MPHLDLPVLVADEAGVEIHLGPQQVLAAPHEVPCPADRLEAEEVVGKHALQGLHPDPGGQDPHEVGLAPGDVGEVVDEAVRHQRPQVGGHQHQVVVVQDDRGGSPRVRRLLGEGFGEAPVHLPVRLPRDPGLAVEAGMLG